MQYFSEDDTFLSDGAYLDMDIYGLSPEEVLRALNDPDECDRSSEPKSATCILSDTRKLIITYLHVSNLNGDGPYAVITSIEVEGDEEEEEQV